MKVLQENEISANHAATKITLISAGVLTLVLILNIVGIFIVDMTQMVICYISGSVLLLVPLLLTKKMKKADEGYTKYIIVACAVLFVGILSAILPKHAVLMYVYPIAISSIYFSKRLNVFATVFTIVVVSMAQLLSFYIPCDKDLNFMDFKSVVLYGIVPRGMILFAIATIFTMLCKRTTTLLGNLMSAEQQEHIREKTAQISETLVGAVKEIDKISEQTAQSGKAAALEAETVLCDSEKNAEHIRNVGENMGRISGNLQELDKMSREIEKLLKQSEEVTAENNNTLLVAENGMREIYSRTDEIMKIMNDLSAQSRHVSEIVQVIEDISSQTDILSINASIEASHAGEAGRGFSIVSQEISNLSMRTKESAKQIKEIISGFTVGINSAVSAMEQSFTLVSDGTKNMERIKNSAEKIDSSNAEIIKNIEDIAGVISGVAKSGGEITDRLAEVSENIGNNYTSVSSVADTINRNSERAQALSGMVKSLKDVSEQLIAFAK
ncbi:MAG: hypothetical protein K2N01_12330 [Lachnospiraceae bacterium]|nr:hypothetical protein [Lachnospiraceae bacterium]